MFLKDRSSLQLSSILGPGDGYSQDRFLDSIWVFRVSCHAIWADQCTRSIREFDESGFSSVLGPVCDSLHRRYSYLLEVRGRARAAFEVSIADIERAPVVC